METGDGSPSPLRFFESEEPKLYTFEEQVTVGIWDDKCIIDFRDVCEDLM